MARIFRNELHEELGTWALGYAPAGGADYGEVVAIAEAVGHGGDDVFHDVWRAAGERMVSGAVAALEAGHRASARDQFLRAAVAYGTAYRPLYGAPVDPRLRAAFDHQIAAFEQGLALGDPPVAPMPIPFGEHPMTGYLIPAAGEAGTKPGPLLILTDGYDATVTDLYFASAVAAVRRGYHVLLFDGPGQGEMLIRRGIPIRPDWEAVIAAAVDAALGSPLVDPGRIALMGWSLGGHLALRAATGEHRLAAVIADPGMWDLTGGFREMAARILPAHMVDQALRGESRPLDRLARVLIDQSPRLRWLVVRRGFFVHGVADVGAYLAATSAFTLDGRLGSIRCPVLLTRAEKDPHAASAERISEALGGRGRILRFAAAEGAGDHCEMMNRSLLNRRVLDWLDTVLARE
ncbi:alpha/beta hydrolase family protein [Amaricoccus solimangrovi]|uniref:Alpha/beta fold hydrolase n=1 Tax=Amaricoccus solimangrovi TaxID=2589815 RepID=A0A501WGT7_9RHOB|nr:alpha/beta fold hydrolase [Amaricoccus solimangrovi]TPE48799.1 alpha/beta fold hydrolase [Amaricoccus solimangrovi]